MRSLLRPFLRPFLSLLRSLVTFRRGFALLCALMMAGPVLADVPHRSAKPAYAEEQTILQAEKNTPEPGFGSASSGKVHIDRHYLGQYGSTEGTVILQRGGNTWRLLRNGPFATVSGFLLLVTPLLILGLYLGMRPAEPARHEAGQRIERFNRWQRSVHWATAYSFLALAVTGIFILFGKKVLLPWMGHDVFYFVAMLSKLIHNFVGPLFIACSIIMFITFLRHNVFRRWDWQWIKGAGGLLSKKEIPAGYFNAGEKLWFWGGVVLLGLLMSATGLVLDFVNFGQTRYVLQIADYLHLAGATLYMVAAMGHIYLGTLGSPGAYQGMREGTVDANWARAHHELWYDEVARGGPQPTPTPPMSPMPPPLRPNPNRGRRE
ncbi:MAG: formate dehydrogenase subunit gamma [Massilia sp.]|nr:formate dehydrogenase subunit gamma [Massilia sp.]